jgi:hypothetical protein
LARKYFPVAAARKKSSSKQKKPLTLRIYTSQRAMEQNAENSFWKSSVKAVPGRPSPKKEVVVLNKMGTKGKSGSTSASFETYQQSVDDAWTISEDELTKEYRILSDDPKLIRRSSQNSSRTHKNPQQIAVVHKPSASTSANSINLTNSITPTTANICNNEPHLDEISSSRDEEPEQRRKASNLSSISERSIEYGYVCVCVYRKII